ncbi:MAG: hypothetical protein MZV70_33145 [Desulfobacterales bacterium]|nr:hypothetical protein [Desulfobacterales bacterium]
MLAPLLAGAQEGCTGGGPAGDPLPLRDRHRRRDRCGMISSCYNKGSADLRIEKIKTG